MADFNLDLASVAEELEVDFNLIVRRFTFGVYSRIMRKSPVDQGRFRGNWIISIGAPIDSVTDSRNKAGSFDVNGNPAKIDGFNIAVDQSLVIQNNLPYAEKLDQGYSTQAPKDFTDIAIREEAQAFDNL